MLMKAPIMTQAMARIAMMSLEKYELMRKRESRMTGLDLTLPSRIWGGGGGGGYGEYTDYFLLY